MWLRNLLTPTLFSIDNIFTLSQLMSRRWYHCQKFSISQRATRKTQHSYACLVKQKLFALIIIFCNQTWNLISFCIRKGATQFILASTMQKVFYFIMYGFWRRSIIEWKIIFDINYANLWFCKLLQFLENQLIISAAWKGTVSLKAKIVKQRLPATAFKNQIMQNRTILPIMPPTRRDIWY